LDRYRRAIAEVYDDFQLVGHVVTRVVLVVGGRPVLAAAPCPSG